MSYEDNELKACIRDKIISEIDMIRHELGDMEYNLNENPHYQIDMRLIKIMIGNIEYFSKNIKDLER